MDKKILLGGAAALLLVGNMYATPANAAIDLSVSGEASVKMAMGDVCSNTNAADNDVEQVLGAADTAAVNALNTDIAITEDAAVTAADGVLGQPVADTSAVASINVAYDDNGCGSANEDNPVLSTDSKFEIAASGTLANGLSIDYENSAALDDYSITFGGAFGSLTVKPGVSAIDESIVGDTAGADVTGPDMGGHKLATDGSAGNAVLYTAPGLGNLDFMISYAPNSDDSGLDDAEYTDTFGVAAVFNSDMITLSAGFENASSEETCGPVDYEFAGASLAYTPVNAENTDTGLDMIETSTAQELTADELFDIVYGRDLCGDQSLVAVGAELSAGDISVSAAYSNLDTDEADQTTTSVGLSTSFGDYSLAAGWAQTVLEYQAGDLEDEQTVIDVSLGTSLGDGVDLDMIFSQNDMSKASQANGGGDTSNYYAAMEVTVGF